jgi:hypothetical protein
LSNGSRASGIVVVTECGRRAEFAPRGDLGAAQCGVGVLVGLTGEIERVERTVAEERHHGLGAQAPSSQPSLADRDPQPCAGTQVDMCASVVGEGEGQVTEQCGEPPGQPTQLSAISVVLVVGEHVDDHRAAAVDFGSQVARGMAGVVQRVVIHCSLDLLTGGWATAGPFDLALELHRVSDGGQCVVSHSGSRLRRWSVVTVPTVGYAA